MAAAPFRRAPRAPVDGCRPGPTVSELSKLVCTARDRRRVYRTARAAAARGRIVLSDRFPLPGVIGMDGPLTRDLAGGNPTGALARLAVRREEHLYEEFAPPDLLFVLRLPVELSLARKREDDPERVARWARAILDTDWRPTGAVVLDASRPAADIAAEMKRHVWNRV